MSFKGIHRPASLGAGQVSVFLDAQFDVDVSSLGATLGDILRKTEGVACRCVVTFPDSTRHRRLAAQRCFGWSRLHLIAPVTGQPNCRTAGCPKHWPYGEPVKLLVRGIIGVFIAVLIAVAYAAIDALLTGNSVSEMLSSPIF